MKFDIDTEANVFQTVWPGGYEESFEGYVNQGYDKYTKKDIQNILRSFYNKEHHCLEIGCGGGMWTKECLIPSFKKVTCLDVCPQRFDGDVTYIQLPNKDFFCSGVDNDSIDFVFSFGVFPHLSEQAQQSYLTSLFKKMKSGGSAVILFANFLRHQDHMNKGEEYFKRYRNTNVSPNGATWFYMDLETAKKMVENAGFVGFNDMIPDFRDTLAYFKKP